MKNNIVKQLIISTSILALGLTSCSNTDRPKDEKFQIVSEIQYDKNSPFYIDIKKYPKNRKSLPIGVFDSGTGGLAVLNSILELDRFNNTSNKAGADELPDFLRERFIYLADEANMPYGKYNAEGKADFLRELIIKDIRFLLDEDYYDSPKNEKSEKGKEPVKAIVIACNTATAYGLETLEKAVEQWGLDIPILGIVDAGSRNAIDLLNPKEIGNSIIGVMATEGTCASNGYPSAILKNAKLKHPGTNIKIVQQPGIGLAGAIDGDLNYIDPTATGVRDHDAYKGPGLNNPLFNIDFSLWDSYNFTSNNNGILVESKEAGEPINVQLNSVANYIKYAVTHLVVNANTKNQGTLASIILGCTHYPYVADEIHNHLQYLKNLNQEYNKTISDSIVLIDPSESLAIELYSYLSKNNLWGNSSNSNSEFYISVPNPQNPNNKIENWEFPYEYKYGRDMNTSEQFVKIVPFSDEWINAEIKKRIEKDIPKTYDAIYNK